ncbi:MAG TPA: IS21 family transposase [Candidatus Krumholzibacteria bacterium]|nr:IS21 family transposase [Candidatus Krumholzibacteria bacterium]
MGVYTDMEQWSTIRRRVLVEGVTKRQILRETGMHWTTLEKILSHSIPPGYQMKQLRRRPKLGPFVDRIREILESDRGVPKKQRHTAKRIFDRLQEEGYEGGYTVVKEVVAELKRTSREVFMPLAHDPGEAQVDYFFALAKIAGLLQKVAIFLMALPLSDAFFLMCTPRECTETFWEGHLRAFEFFGGVPRRISYDNSRIAVRSILGVHRRKLTEGFLELVSHYLFDYHFCTIRRPNEKGVVETTGKYARRNFMVPVPVVGSYEELNTHLLERCQADLGRRVRGGPRTKAELLAEESSNFLPFPKSPFDACRKQTTRVNSLSLVRFHGNDYSVPVRYGHHPVTVKGYWDRVEICRGPERLARHARLWTKGETSYDPRHYLALLDRKPGALDHGLPLQGLDLPECFDLLRRRLEDDRGHQGTKEYIKVLRMLERHSIGRVAKAIEQALAVRAPSASVVGVYLYPDEQTQPATFLLDGRPHLQSVRIDPPRLKVYESLLPQGVTA